MPKYYYHPLGEWAQYFIDNYDKWIAHDAETRRTFPHTYDGHGWGQLDWGVPANLPVYSMTDGEVVKIWSGSGRGRGIWVVVKTDRKDATGQTVYISYGELQGLSEITAGLCGVTAGPGVEPAAYYVGSHPIKMGDMLGYTNSFNEADYSNMHTDWHYENTFDSSSKEGHCTVEGAKLVDAFTIESNGDKKKVLFNNQILGPDDGIYAPKQIGTSSFETIYPMLQSMVMLQKPEKIISKKSNFEGISEPGWYPSDDSATTGIEGYFSNGKYTFPIFKQGRGPWAGKPFMSGETYASSGCSQCATATVISGITGKLITPTDVTAVFTELYGVKPGGFSTDGQYTWNSGTVAEYYGAKSLGSSKKSSGLTMTQGLEYLKQGYPMVLNVAPSDRWGNGYTTGGGHLITLLGYDPTTDKVFLGDPAHPSGWFSKTPFMNKSGSYQESLSS